MYQRKSTVDGFVETRALCCGFFTGSNKKREEFRKLSYQPKPIRIYREKESEVIQIQTF